MNKSHSFLPFTIMLLLAAILIFACRADFVAAAGPCSIEGQTYLDLNQNGAFEPWSPRNEPFISGVTIALNTGATRVSAWGWYGFSSLPSGSYVVTAGVPEGYQSVTPLVLSVNSCSGPMTQKNFGFIQSAAPTATSTPTPLPTATPIPLPWKGGLAIANDISLEVAARVGVRKVLLYWGTPVSVTSALGLGLLPVVGISDCNLTPARWSQIATVARDRPGLTWMWLNEPDIYEQSGRSCGAATSPYDASYDLTKAARQFAALTGLIWSFDPMARFIYGNEAVALGTWHTRLETRWDELYGLVNQPNLIQGWHIYPAWWLGQTVDNFGGWQTRLNAALAHSAGNIILTEVGMQGASDPVALFHWLLAITDAEPRVETVFWISFGDAPFLNPDGSFTVLGQAFVEEMN